MLANLAPALFLAAAFLAGAALAMLVMGAFSWRRDRDALRGSYDATATNTETAETVALEYKSAMTDAEVISAYRANTRPT